MDESTPPVTSSIQYPHIRSYVMEALEGLRDLETNLARYRRDGDATPPFLDLTMSVHVLYDDYTVLPDPRSALGQVLLQSDLAPLELVDHVLGPVIDALGNATDDAYTADPRWPSVVIAAEAALRAMKAVPTPVQAD